MIDDPHARKATVLGWFLLAMSLPLGLTLEALHALKVEVYLGSPLRRELWTLAHAHGNVLGILCLVFGGFAATHFAEAQTRASISRWLRIGAVLMPLGFFAGGVMNFEGDPSLGIALVPIGGVCLLFALVRAGLAARRGGADAGDAS